MRPEQQQAVEQTSEYFKKTLDFLTIHLLTCGMQKCDLEKHLQHIS